MSTANLQIVTMTEEHVDGAVDLQRACFPPPFSEDLHWKPGHLRRHLELFPEGQFVALLEDRVVGTASNSLVSEAAWTAHADWTTTVGGPYLERFDPNGSTLYGLDISVHPDVRRQGIARRLYEARFGLVRSRRLARYGTACRIPDFRTSGLARQEDYVAQVAAGVLVDRTLSPLLKMGLRLAGVIHAYMEDDESGDAAALLEWTPEEARP